MGNIVCQKCGINREYYRYWKKGYIIRPSCRYHSHTEKNCNCLDCGFSIHKSNCYHTWKYSLC